MVCFVGVAGTVAIVTIFFFNIEALVLGDRQWHSFCKSAASGCCLHVKSLCGSLFFSAGVANDVFNLKEYLSTVSSVCRLIIIIKDVGSTDGRTDCAEMRDFPDPCMN
jgi:hypothetical protein